MSLAFNILFVTGLVCAVCSLGVLAICACGEILWRRDQRRAARRLAASDRECRMYEREAQRLTAFTAQLHEIRDLPIANPWDVA